jgi:hypothetical protein
MRCRESVCIRFIRIAVCANLPGQTGAKAEALFRAMRVLLLAMAAVCLCAGSLTAQTAYVGGPLGGGFSAPKG